jgi:hypothetical protein
VSRQVTTVNWTWLTTLGLAGGLIGGLLIGKPLGELVNAMVTTAAVTCFVGGVLGSFQAFGLRPVLRRPLWWVLGTVAGLGIGLAAGVVVVVEQLGTLLAGARPNPFTRAISLVILGSVAGTVLGVAQWLVLRSQAPRIRHWVATTAIGLAISFCAGSLLLTAVGLRISSGLGVGAFVVVSGLMFGAITSRPLQRAA